MRRGRPPPPMHQDRGHEGTAPKHCRDTQLLPVRDLPAWMNRVRVYRVDRWAGPAFQDPNGRAKLAPACQRAADPPSSESPWNVLAEKCALYWGAVRAAGAKDPRTLKSLSQFHTHSDPSGCHECPRVSEGAPPARHQGLQPAPVASRPSIASAAGLRCSHDRDINSETQDPWGSPAR